MSNIETWNYDPKLFSLDMFSSLMLAVIFAHGLFMIKVESNAKGEQWDNTLK